MIDPWLMDACSSDYLPDDAAFICQNEEDAGQLEKLGFTNVRWFHEEAMKIGEATIYRVDARHGETDELAAWTGSTSGFVFVSAGEKTLYLAGDPVFIAPIT